MKTAFVVALGLVMALVWTGCGGTQMREGGDSAPEWFDNPTPGCGVGTKRIRGSRGLARDGAVHKARLDLSKQLEVTVQGLLKDYESEGEEDGLDFSEGTTTSVSRSVVDQTLDGTRPQTVLVGDEYFAQVCIDPEAFAGAFERMRVLSAKARAALARRAKAHFEELDAELEKRAAH